MDVNAGMPILGAWLAAVLLLLWLSWQQRWIERCVHAYSRRQVLTLTSPLQHTSLRVRRMVITSMFAAPALMAFSGQIDSYGIAHIYHDTLQIIAPLISACFAATMLWLLIVSPRVVHATHCRLLDLFHYPGQRREFW